MAQRAVDNAITPRCPACHLLVTFQGEGLILDRRTRSQPERPPAH